MTTVTPDGAAHFAVGRFTNTTMAACFQGCAASGCAEAARVGVCVKLTLVNLNTALTVGPITTVTTGTLPTFFQVSPFTLHKGLVVWFNSATGHINGKGKVIAFSGNGDMTFPAAVFNFGTADAVLTYVAMTVLDYLHALVCYNEGGSTAKCQAIALDNNANTAAAAAVTSLETVASSYIGIGRSDNTTVRVCYVSVPPSPPGTPPPPPPTALTCRKITLKEDNTLLERPTLALPSAGDGPQGVTTSGFDECSNLNCYLKAPDGSTPASAVCAISGADVVTVANGGSCPYYLNGYACPEEKCRDDVWDPTPTCAAGCRMSNVPATPSGGGNSATAVCSSSFGTCFTDVKTPPLEIVVEDTPGLQASAMFSDIGAGDKEGVLCYKTTAGPTACVAIKKAAAGLSKGSTPAVLHVHAIAENAFTLVRISTTAGFACFNDANAGNIGTCKAFAFASNEVTVATPAATFSAAGIAVSVA